MNKKRLYAISIGLYIFAVLSIGFLLFMGYTYAVFALLLVGILGRRIFKLEKKNSEKEMVKNE